MKVLVVDRPMRLHSKVQQGGLLQRSWGSWVWIIGTQGRMCESVVHGSPEHTTPILNYAWAGYGQWTLEGQWTSNEWTGNLQCKMASAPSHGILCMVQPAQA